MEVTWICLRYIQTTRMFLSSFGEQTCLTLDQWFPRKWPGEVECGQNTAETRLPVEVETQFRLLWILKALYHKSKPRIGFHSAPDHSKTRLTLKVAKVMFWLMFMSKSNFEFQFLIMYYLGLYLSVIYHDSCWTKWPKNQISQHDKK